MKFPFRALIQLALLMIAAPLTAQTARMPIPYKYKVPAKSADVFEPLAPSQVQMTGYLGKRVNANAQNRLLLAVDLKPLLEGYQKRPGGHPWIGEHIGKWLHAATLAWSYTGDKQLKAKIDGAVHALVQTQEADGYLGTYVKEKRFGLYNGADWDVWSHKYNLLGLLTYYQYTGSAEALDCCRRMGDLLINTFGKDKKSILSAGTHIGMAATSVLEPIVLLYRHTADRRYLDFAKYIVEAWEEQGGPHVLSTLTKMGRVDKTANGKAYEMLSNLVGLCELYRATGDKPYLIAAQNAWKDVVANQLYITGTASHFEHFHDPHDLPNKPSADIGETCVTVTWIQLNSQLLRLTGEAKYGQELERSYYNHLMAAQRPDGKEWCYYTALEGTKPYGPGINCCVSSGPRGMAMAPQMVFFRDGRGRGSIVVNMFETAKTIVDYNGTKVPIEMISELPFNNRVRIIIHAPKPMVMCFMIRIPAWAQGAQAEIPVYGLFPLHRFTGDWFNFALFRCKPDDVINLHIPLEPRLVNGSYSNKGLQALAYGPLVMAFDDTDAKGSPPPRSLAFPANLSKVVVSKTDDAPMLKLPVTFGDETRTATFLPFGYAGAKGENYRIWLYAHGAKPEARLTPSLLSAGEESRSRNGNANGSINDYDRNTYVVTFDSGKQAEDWYAVTLPKPISIRRVVYAHGRSFHDGGWFDSTATGKPRIEIQETPNGAWRQVGVLEEYPNTTATDSMGLKSGATFTLNLPVPLKIVAIRVLGTPSHGDNPNQSFSSCAELQAFDK